MKIMENYYYLYSKYGALLLVNVFEKPRNNSLGKYGLCPSHYLTAPGCSQDTMFKITKTELEIIPDHDIHRQIIKKL